MDSRYIFIVDSMDPLRKVYDFLADDYADYIGRPLYTIPAPDPTPGCPSDLPVEECSYADYFLKDFILAL